MGVDLYDRWKANPKLIESLENTVPNKIARGGSFKLPALHILEIPDRQVLRDTMLERYGIDNIDAYYTPLIVDTLTYRQLTGVPEPDVFSKDYSRISAMAEGHVKKANGHFISYISANLPIDMAIEHEGIHAYTFKRNKHYAKPLSRYQMCYRYGWAMSSKQPDRYIDKEGIGQEKVSEAVNRSIVVNGKKIEFKTQFIANAHL